jgi:CheY-like chemotaxis protein
MADGARKKVLLVEDDAALGELCRGVLRLSGFDVAHVIDGLSALRFVESESPDLIVLDMTLPVLQGDDLLREIAARPDLRQIPAGQTDSSEALPSGSACFRGGATRSRGLTLPGREVSVSQPRRPERC